jgi:hypothetical protein
MRVSPSPTSSPKMARRKGGSKKRLRLRTLRCNEDG